MVGDSRRLALRIHVPDADVTKTLVFDALMTVGQACDQIRHQIREIDGLDNRKSFFGVVTRALVPLPKRTRFLCYSLAWIPSEGEGYVGGGREGDLISLCHYVSRFLR